MANTTNYNWETPDDTDLVKDGAAAIRTLGSSIDTTTKALNPSTTLGDIEYRSSTANTNTRLAIGSTGQVLTVAGGVPSWATPTTGDIEGVTAGTGISGGGTSGTVTITNSMATAIDAKGDLVVGTGADTFSRLAVGTNNQVLTCDSAEATGLKWAAASSGALTLIQRSSFSGVAGTGTTFDGVFTSTYSSYLIMIESIYAATATDDFEFQLRYAGPTTMNVQYLGSGSKLDVAGTVSWIDNYDEAQFKLGDQTGDSGFPGGGQIFINGVGNASERATWRGQFLGGQNAVNYYFAGNQYNAQTYTGILFKSSSSNITGTIAIYGMAK